MSIEPLHPDLADIAGEDTWQAVQLTMRLVDLLLEGVVERGGRLYWAGDDGKPDGEYDVATPPRPPQSDT